MLHQSAPTVCGSGCLQTGGRDPASIQLLHRPARLFALEVRPQTFVMCGVKKPFISSQAPEIIPGGGGGGNVQLSGQPRGTRVNSCVRGCLGWDPSESRHTPRGMGGCVSLGGRGWGGPWARGLRLESRSGDPAAFPKADPDWDDQTPTKWPVWCGGLWRQKLHFQTPFRASRFTSVCLSFSFVKRAVHSGRLTRLRGTRRARAAECLLRTTRSGNIGSCHYRCY